LTHPKKAVGRKDNGLSYRLYSLKESGEFNEEVDPASFIVKAEEYGVPQARHRMFIVGIRSDFDIEPETLQKQTAPTVRQIIGGKSAAGICHRSEEKIQNLNLLSDLLCIAWVSVLNLRFCKLSLDLRHGRVLF
jgi:DNA (cytosine-5)-methyltransferase 1